MLVSQPILCLKNLAFQTKIEAITNLKEKLGIRDKIISLNLFSYIQNPKGAVIKDNSCK